MRVSCLIEVIYSFDLWWFYETGTQQHHLLHSLTEVLENRGVYSSLSLDGSIEPQLPVSRFKLKIKEDLFQKKSFANYEEVVPFIAFLESLFTVIDPDAEVIIKSKENQIFIDHFADYTVYFEVNENKELIFKALDELDKSRFIINILNFSMDYKPAGDENLNQLSEVELVIRLFLK